MKTSTMFAATVALTSLLGLAAAGAAKADPEARRSPPQEAFDACKSAKDGDACTVTFHDHSHAGTCAQFGTQGLACRPKPPQAAIDACASSKAGDACTVTFDSRQVTGTCAAPADDVLACRPARPRADD